jgi:hypothetical protein
VWRRGVKEFINFLAADCVVARADASVPMDVAVEFRRTVVFPQPAEDAAERPGAGCFCTLREITCEESAVNLLYVRGAEGAGFESTTDSNDETGGLENVRTLAAGLVLGEE